MRSLKSIFTVASTVRTGVGDDPLMDEEVGRCAFHHSDLASGVHSVA